MLVVGCWSLAQVKILAVLGLFCSIRDKFSWTCQSWRWTENKNLHLSLWCSSCKNIPLIWEDKVRPDNSRLQAKLDFCVPSLVSSVATKGDCTEVEHSCLLIQTLMSAHNTEKKLLFFTPHYWEWKAMDNYTLNVLDG